MLSDFIIIIFLKSGSEMLSGFFCINKIKINKMKTKKELRPFSDLAKVIEINGEKFIPIIELAKIENVNDFSNKPIIYEKGYDIGIEYKTLDVIECRLVVNTKYSIESYLEGTLTKTYNVFELYKKLAEWGFIPNELNSIEESKKDLTITECDLNEIKRANANLEKVFSSLTLAIDVNINAEQLKEEIVFNLGRIMHTKRHLGQLYSEITKSKDNEFTLEYAKEYGFNLVLSKKENIVSTEKYNIRFHNHKTYLFFSVFEKDTNRHVISAGIHTKEDFDNIMNFININKI